MTTWQSDADVLAEAAYEAAYADAMAEGYEPDEAIEMADDARDAVYEDASHIVRGDE